MLFRGGKFLSLKKKSGIVFLIPFYDTLKDVSLQPIDLKIPQTMVIAPDKEKIYFSGTLTIKIKDVEKAYTSVDNFQEATVRAVCSIIEDNYEKNIFSDIKAKKKEIDDKILQEIKEKIEIWSLEVKKIRINLER